MTSIRTARAAEGKFTQLANAMLFDNRLDLDTRGLISFMLALPPDTTFTIESLMKRTGRGRDAIGRMLKQAEDAGYFVRRRHRDATGQWQWEQIISDGPVENPPIPGNPYDGNPVNGLTCGNTTSSQVAPSTGNPSDGEAVAKRSKTLTSNTSNTSLSGTLGDMLRAAVPDADEREIEEALKEIKFRKATGKIDVERAWLRTIIANGDAPAFVAECFWGSPARKIPEAKAANTVAARVGGAGLFANPEHDGAPCEHGSPGGKVRNQFGTLRCPLCRANDTFKPTASTAA